MSTVEIDLRPFGSKVKLRGSNIVDNIYERRKIHQPVEKRLNIRDRSRTGAPRADKWDRRSPDPGASCRQRGALRRLLLFSEQLRKVDSQKFTSRMLHRSTRWLTCARCKPYRLHKVIHILRAVMGYLPEGTAR